MESTVVVCSVACRSRGLMAAATGSFEGARRRMTSSCNAKQPHIGTSEHNETVGDMQVGVQDTYPGFKQL